MTLQYPESIADAKLEVAHLAPAADSTFQIDDPAEANPINAEVDVVIVDTAAGVCQVNLPKASSSRDGHQIIFKQIGANALTIATFGTDTIDQGETNTEFASADERTLGVTGSYAVFVLDKENESWDLIAHDVAT